MDKELSFDDTVEQIDELLEAQGFEKWQIEVLRNELIAYKAIYFPKDKACQIIANNIKRLTSLEIGHEAIRRFEQNKNYREPDEDQDLEARHLRTLALYLLHPETDSGLDFTLLKRGKKPNYQLPIELANYYQPKRQTINAGYFGNYLHIKPLRNASRCLRNLYVYGEVEQVFYEVNEVISKQIQSLQSDDVIDVHNYIEGVKQREVFEPESLGDDESRFANRWQGWAIFVEDNKLEVSLKEIETCKAKNYISIVDTSVIADQKEMQKLVFVEHGDLLSSIEIKNDESLKNNLVKKVIIFQRVEKLSGKSISKRDTMKKDGKVPSSDEKKKSADELPDLADNPFAKGGKRFLGPSRQKEEQQKERTVMDDNQIHLLGKALFDAVEEFDTETVRELLKQGASPNARDSGTGVTPFHCAAAWGDWDTLEALLNTEQCDLLIRDYEGRLASQFCAQGARSGCREWSDKLRSMEMAQGKERGILPLYSGDQKWPQGFEYGVNSLADFERSGLDEPSMP